MSALVIASIPAWLRRTAAVCNIEAKVYLPGIGILPDELGQVSHGAHLAG